MKISVIGFLAFLLAIVAGCNTDLTGEMEPNQAPETHTVVDTIKRQGENRLNSEVHIRWWGDDPDGYVDGFEFRFDGGNWTFTPSNDSVFLLSPPPGNDTIDFQFEVRAIDNQGTADPTPAILTYPIRNSRPTAEVIPGAYAPKESFPVLRITWQGNDPDGFENISHFEFAWNDTTGSLLEVDKFTNSATFIAQNPDATQSEFDIYLNNEETAWENTTDNIAMNDTNRFYVRTVDNSGALSRFAQSEPIYVKPVKARMLMVNAYTSNFSTIETFYAETLNEIGITDIDTLRIFEREAGVFINRAPDNLTQSRIFELFDFIIWYGSNASENLSLAQKTTGDFFNGGGKMMMSMYISSTFDEQSQFLEFTPVRALITPEDTTLLLNVDDTLTSSLPGYPDLVSTSIVGVVKPLLTEIGSQPAYQAPLLARDKSGQLSDWKGVKDVMAIRGESGQANFFFSTLELHRLNGLGNMDQLFNKVIVDEFGY